VNIDLHTHTKTGSDGAPSTKKVFKEAKRRNINVMSITDHDTTDCQQRAIALIRGYGIDYIIDVELNVTPQYNNKAIPPGFPGIPQYDISNQELQNKSKLIRGHREA